ncbi:efflux transporter outer membrane subunit [Chitinophaga arvensicola]|uniref:Efflux transporter, outer membrane factor (OMF) lipoprotein, NodT family n=1 Tax=Chitinophaga arvensicola TaxID=29529 RepID=A0A1I0SC24_9BACT|nr:efflux transporter outer membrane subunit [Chitinophaga arvensicola]SEW54597.1 efflux transporter, outer membrane factor (OMF) lipoprotein, NodT family [Chitinophaga arvensicola]
MNKYFSSYALYAAMATITVACSTQKELALPERVPVPVVPANNNDTLSLANFTQVFNDPNLRSLIDTALRNNYDLLSAAQRVATAQANLMMAKNAWLPSLNLSLSAGVDKYSDYSLNGVGNYDTNLSPNISKDQRIPGPTPEYFAGLRSSWEIDLWGKLKSQRQATYARFLASEQGRRLLTTQIVAGVTGLYYELTAMDNELAIIQRNIGLQETAVATVHIQKAGGRATELAVQQFTAQLLSTQALAFGVKQEIASLENQLNALLGRFPQPIVRTVAKDAQALPDAVQKGIPGSLLLQRPDVQQAELELAASKADVKAARAAFLPGLTITPYAGFNAFKAGLLFQSPASIAWGAVGNLTAPIFNKKQIRAQYNISTANAYTAFYGYQQALVNGYQEVASALNKVENQREAYTLKNKEVLVLQEAVSTANLLFTTGYANYLEVITAQKNVLEAELALVTTRRNVYQGMVSLYRALGGN